MRVVTRMSPDLNWDDALEAHPEWAMRNKDGSVHFSGENPLACLRYANLYTHEK
jgi:hypothetical protein